jgi:hypothetical protein
LTFGFRGELALLGGWRDVTFVQCYPETPLRGREWTFNVLIHPHDPRQLSGWEALTDELTSMVANSPGESP